MTLPRDTDDVRQMVADAAAAGTPLELVGRGTKRGLGRPVQAAATLDLSGLTGITLYEPDELVMTARAGTPLAVSASTWSFINAMSGETTTVSPSRARAGS